MSTEVELKAEIINLCDEINSIRKELHEIRMERNQLESECDSLRQHNKTLLEGFQPLVNAEFRADVRAMLPVLAGQFYAAGHGASDDLILQRDKAVDRAIAWAEVVQDQLKEMKKV